MSMGHTYKFFGCATSYTILNLHLSILYLTKALKGPWPVWLSWLEHCSIEQGVMKSIPVQDTCLGCGFGPWLRCIWEATDWCFSLTSMFLSLSLFPSLPLSLKAVSMSVGEDKKINKQSCPGNSDVQGWTSLLYSGNFQPLVCIKII